MKDLRDLIRVNGDGPKVRLGQKYLGGMQHYCSPKKIGAEETLAMIGSIAPQYVNDALCKWIQEEGGPE